MTQKNKFTPYIWIISIVIPVVVAILFTVRIPNVASLSFLPPIYATVNGITAVILLLALNAIKSKNIKLHENLMKTAIALSLAFFIDVCSLSYDFRLYSLWWRRIYSLWLFFHFDIPYYSFYRNHSNGFIYVCKSIY